MLQTTTGIARKFISIATVFFPIGSFDGQINRIQAVTPALVINLRRISTFTSTNSMFGTNVDSIRFICLMKQDMTALSSVFIW